VDNLSADVQVGVQAQGVKNIRIFVDIERKDSDTSALSEPGGQLP